MNNEPKNKMWGDSTITEEKLDYFYRRLLNLVELVMKRTNSEKECIKLDIQHSEDQNIVKIIE